MISTSQFKTGVVIKYEGGLYEILEFQLVKMQQRQPIVRTRLKNIKSGNVLEQPFRSGEKFEEIYLEEKPIQFLYHTEDKYHFMDSTSYNEVVVFAPVLGDNVKYLKENAEILGRYCGEELIDVNLGSSVVLKITQTEPGIRGDTAKSGSKPAQVETGATIKVPLFVNTGDSIRVDTRTGEYVERA